MAYVLSAFNLRSESQLLASIGYGQITVRSVIQVFLGEVSPKFDAQTESDPWAQTLMDLNEVGEGEGAGVGGSAGGVIVGGKKDVLIHFCRSVL
jgi:(p)ppGpp synthase/HD superfamily hydrolase